jgi:calmodulin
MQINSEDLKKINVEILTNKEKQKCYEAFVAFDKNASGYIEKDELRKVLEEMGQKPTEEELIKMINDVDSSGRGAIGSHPNLTFSRQRRFPQGYSLS